MKKFGVFLSTFLLSAGVLASGIYDLTDTWNSGATTFNAIKIAVTDTASAADSKLLNLTATTGGIFQVSKDGSLTLSGTVNGRDLAADGTKLDGIAPGAQTGDLLAAGTIPLTANWDVGAFGITALRFISDQATGTAPFDVASTTVVTNLNADLLDGNNSLSFATAAQGTLADSATQPADNISTLTNDTGFITSVEGSAVLSTGEIGGNKFLREDGDGTSSWQAIAGGGDLINDTTPQLGGDLDVNGFDISQAAPLTDIVTTDFVVEGQSALLGATVNTSAGNLDLKMGDHATAGGSAGLVRILAPDDTVAFSIDEDGDLAGKTFIADLADGNYAYGLGAGDSITVGSGVDNITIGENAGTAITTNDRNIAIGTSSLMTLGAGGDQNIAIGFEALRVNVNGDDNVAIGWQAAENVTGNDNVALGTGALDHNGSSGGENIAIGRNAMGSTSVIGIGNIAIGSFVSDNITSGSNNVSIGNRIEPASPTDSGQLSIGANATNVSVPAIYGYMGSGIDADMSDKSLTISGPSALIAATTNQDGGNLILQAGQKATGGGSNGLTLVNDTAYAIMSIQANVTGETTVDGTPRKVTAWNTDGISNGITPDHTTGDDITCGVAGTYKVNVNLSFSGTNSSVITVELYKNGAAAGFALERTLNAAGAVGAASISGIVNCAATDTFEVYQSSTGSAITFTEGQFTAHRLSN